MRRSTTTHAPPTAPAFANTRWSLILDARHPSQPAARQALEDLCRTYWSPLYAYIRRQGIDPHQAEDLTQEFFAQFLSRDSFSAADPARGRFRSYLLGALKHFLANHWNKQRAQKRGGSIPHLPLDPSTVESQLGLDPGHSESPDRLYDRQWTLALLDRVLQRLETEQHTAGNAAQFHALKPTLTASPNAVHYATLAAQLQSSEGAVKVAVHRLRKRYRHLLREEIRDTVHHEADIDDELRHLLSSL